MKPVATPSRRFAILMAHAVVGWLLCAAAMGTLLATLPEPQALLVHLGVAPLLGAALAYVYFGRPNPVAPPLAALVIVGTIGLLDLLVVALVILGSLAMFRSAIGTWIPLGAMLLAIWLVGTLRLRRQGHEGWSRPALRTE